MTNVYSTVVPLLLSVTNHVESVVVHLYCERGSKSRKSSFGWWVLQQSKTSNHRVYHM